MLTRFRDKKVDRDWLNSNFPCMMACPAGTNAGRYVALIAEGRFEEAYRYARDPNPMASICGRVCAHPCETACRRGAVDKPIQIRALKRMLTERYGPESRRPLRIERRRAAPQPYRVAVVGSGPVGLSAAHDLGLMGYSVTIFEAAPVAGGMLKLGIPEYRLPRSVVEAQVREILEAGDIELRLNQAAGRDFTISGLRRQGFDAVVIAVGAHRSRDLSIPGVDLDGVHKAVDFLLNANLGYRFTIGKKVVVIGGGNVAMDVARSAAREVLRQHATVPEDAVPSEENVAAVAAHEMVDVSLSALRLGAQEVSIVCLEKRQEMPAAFEEIEEAETEGIILHDGRGPHRVLGRDGKVIGLETLKTMHVFDANRPLQSRILRKQRIRHRVRHGHPGDRPGTQSRLPEAGRRRPGFATRVDCGGPGNPDDLGARRVCGRGLRVRPAPHHRQRGRRQAHRHRHRRIPNRAETSRPGDCGGSARSPQNVRGLHELCRGSLFRCCRWSAAPA